MTDYRDYKKVLSSTKFSTRQWRLILECGHNVFRYTKVAPKKVKCESCDLEKIINSVKEKRTK